MIKLKIFKLIILASIISGPIFSYPWFFNYHGIDVAHDNNILGKGLRIAILDTPPHRKHPLLDDPRISEEYCFTDNQELKNMSKHGTTVTSILGAKATEQFPNFIGVAPQATIATFGVPEKGCGLLVLEQALQKIKDFKPDIINASSNLLTLEDKKIALLLNEIFEQNPNVVVVLAAGNDGSVLSPGDIPCSKGKAAQHNLQTINTHKYKDNFVFVGNMARKSDIDFGKLLVLPNDDPLRQRKDIDFSDRHYSLSRSLTADNAVKIIEEYLASIGMYRREDYFSSFDAFNAWQIVDSLSRASDNEILLIANKYDPTGNTIPSDFMIEREVVFDAFINDFSTDNAKIADLIAKKKATRDLNRALAVKAIKNSYCIEKIAQNVSQMTFTDNAPFKEMSAMFKNGLPASNSDLLQLSKDLIPIRYDDKLVLAPLSARAGGLAHFFISALGTNIPGASFEFEDQDKEQINPLFKLTTNNGTSIAAPILSGAIALVCEACKIGPKEALRAILEHADKSHNKWEVFGEGMLSIKTLIKTCVSKK